MLRFSQGQWTGSGFCYTLQRGMHIGRGKSSYWKRKSTKTILRHPEKYHVNNAIKLGDYNVGRSGQILTLPLYMAFLLRAY